MQVKKTDLPRARRLANVFRFIDDLIAINDGGEFERSFKEIYPPELELKRENAESSAGSFLDLLITIKNNKFCIQLFDKRDEFPFCIVRMPYLSSNIPSKMFYSAFGAEILRAARTTSSATVFLNSSKTLVTRLCNQGGNLKILTNTLNKIFGRHFSTFRKFYNTSLEFVDSITI